MQYFAGANTKNGFCSIFEECFKNVERLFLLKGSSGCGKSTFMRRIAGKAQKLNLETELIFCSADPNSLDGIIIPKLNVAVADGTSPHSMDVKYPCVRESIINLGQFWDESKLIPRRSEIIALTDRKSEHYKNAYRCLSAKGSIDELKKSLLKKCISRETLEETAFRFFEKLKNGTQGKTKTVFASSFCAQGVVTLPVFDDVKNLYRVVGRGADMLINSIASIAKEKGERVTVSLSPSDAFTVDAVYFHGSESLITCLETPPCASAENEKTVATSKFTDSENMVNARSKIRALERLSDEIAQDAQNELTIAKNVHSKLESIYIPAMNFKSLDEYTFEFLSRIFSE